MRRQIGVFVAACLYYSGLVKLTRWWAQRSPQPCLIILNYHRAGGGDLRRHLLYLRRYYRVLHLEEALKELYAPPKDGKSRRDRRTLLVLTFDDGYRDNYTHGFALARELQVPFTIFIIPGYIGSNEPFWWREGERLAHHAQVDRVTIAGHTYHLCRRVERSRVEQAIDARARYARSVAERESFLADTRKALGVSCCAGEEEGAMPLTWAQVREMQESGLVSFGAHTMHHPILANLADPAEVDREVAECRAALEQHLGHPVLSFAYPVGQPEHIGEWGLQAVSKAGYRWALTTMYGANTPQSDPHRLRRVKTEVQRHWLVLAAETSGIWRLFSHLWKNPMVRWIERS